MHGFPARQMNETVSPVTDYQDQTARADCVDGTKKTVASNAWTAPASATAPRSPILLPRRLTSAIVALALWLLHPSAGCPTRKVGLSKKKKKRAHADRKREQGVVAMVPGLIQNL